LGQPGESLIEVYQRDKDNWRDRMLLLYNKVPHWNEG